MSDSTTPTADGTVERTAEGGVIRFERRLPYAIDDVWDAITDPARLADWWLPFEAEITVDLQPGGLIVFSADGDEPIHMACTIVRVEAPTLLEHTHIDEGSMMRWELEPTDAGCVLRLSHFVPDADVAIERCYVVGLHASLSRLEPSLAGAPIAWDWSEFAASQARYAELGFAPTVEGP
jgi:uncharacterized protein YndB with AHSA1/START domain